MRRRLISIMSLMIVAALASPALAQRQSQRAPFAPERVSVLTDGLADPASPSVRMMNDLAARLGQGGMRVLPIAGDGGLPNLRDLLLLKGVDLAILNSDILAYLDLTGTYPEARRRIRQVTHLQDHTVYLFARRELTSLPALRDRKVAVLAGGITAATVFGTHQIAVDLQAIQPAQLANEQSLRGIDAVLLLGDEIARLAPAALDGFRLLDIPQTPALAQIYRPIRIAPADLGALPRPVAPIDSIAVATVLAVFDWTPQQSRYANVSTFMKALFSALPALRDGPAGAHWRQADVRSIAPGWTRYAAADPVKLLSAAQLEALAVVDQPVVRVAAPATAVPTEKRRALSMLVVNRAPLTDERAADGGLIPALLSSGFATADRAGGARPVIKWSKPDPISLQLLGTETASDLLLPWDAADCDRTSDLTQTQALLCDRATASEPIMQVVVGLFTAAGSDFKFETDASIRGRGICVPADRDLSELAAPGRNWIAEKRITLLRQPSLIDCAGMVQRREADAFVATDLEGWHVLQHFGIASLFAMAERPLGTRTLHAAVWKSHPQADEMLAAVNAAIRQSKDSGAHASLMRQHLLPVWQNKAAGVR